MWRGMWRSRAAGRQAGKRNCASTPAQGSQRTELAAAAGVAWLAAERRAAGGMSGAGRQESSVQASCYTGQQQQQQQCTCTCTPQTLHRIHQPRVPAGSASPAAVLQT
jgi:hypothetical protein